MYRVAIGILIFFGAATILRIRWDRALNRDKILFSHDKTKFESKNVHIPKILTQFIDGNPGEKKIPPFIEIHQEGMIFTHPKSDGMRMRAHQIFSTESPGFIWMAHGMFPLPLHVIDSYVDGKGSMKISFAKLFSMGEKGGKEIDESSLVRYVSEAVLFPQSLIDNDYITWKDIDSTTLIASIDYKGIKTYVTFRFNEDSTVQEVAAKRYRDENGRMTLRDWRGTFDEYRIVDGIFIPTKVAAYWTMDSGEFKYIDMKITKVKEWRVPDE